MRFTPDIEINTIMMLLGTSYKVDFYKICIKYSELMKLSILPELTVLSLNPKIIDANKVLVKTNLISRGYVGVLKSRN